jgi:hypothetical protein
LISGLEARARDVVSVFDLWNRTLFPEGIVMDSHVGKSSGLQEALRLRQEAELDNDLEE